MIGHRILQWRTDLVLSQEQPGDGLNLTCQRIQKFESAFNRVPVSRLADLATALNVSLG